MDEFELNGMNVYVWYDVVSMFVNDVVCDRDIVSSVKDIPVLRLLGCALFGDSKKVSWLYCLWMMWCVIET